MFVLLLRNINKIISGIYRRIMRLDMVYYVSVKHIRTLCLCN